MHAPVGLEEADWVPIGQQWADWIQSAGSGLTGGLSASSRPIGSNRPAVGQLDNIFKKYKYNVIFIKFNIKIVLFEKN